MCLYTNIASWPTVLRIWDFFFIEENLALFRFGVSILKNCEQEILHIQLVERMIPFLLRIEFEKLEPETLIQISDEFDINLKYQEALQKVEKQQQEEMLRLLENKSPVKELKRKVPTNNEEISNFQSKPKKPSLWNSIVTNGILSPKSNSPRSLSKKNATPSFSPARKKSFFSSKSASLSVDEKENLPENNFFSPLKRVTSPNSKEFVNFYAEDFHLFTSPKQLPSPQRQIKKPLAKQTPQKLIIKEFELKTFNETEDV